jgi:hypothetical protein
LAGRVEKYRLGISGLSNLLDDGRSDIIVKDGNWSLPVLSQREERDDG